MNKVVKSPLDRELERIESRSKAAAGGRDAAAPREIFDRAYAAAMSRPPRLIERLTRTSGAIRAAAAAALVVLAGGTLFHAAEYRHAWVDLSPIQVGDTIHASSPRDITVYVGFTPAKVIRLDQGASIKRESNRWELSKGNAAIRVRHNRAEHPFHLKAGELHLVSSGPVEYTVDAVNAGPHAITVSVRQGTVQCCDLKPEFPIDAGDRITLKREPGSATQIVALETE